MCDSFVGERVPLVGSLTGILLTLSPAETSNVASLPHSMLALRHCFKI